MTDHRDTIAAIATPPGRGAIGIVRISGPGCAGIGAAMTGSMPAPGRYRYCAFRGADGEILDRGLLLYFRAPASYTGEDVIELQGHGGQAVLNRVLQRVQELGARLARPGEFTERAFLNDKLDLLQAEAVADLIDSASTQAVRSAMRSLEGDFSRRLDELLQCLIELRLQVEGALDFPDEELDLLADSGVEQYLADLAGRVDALRSCARAGKVLREGLRVVIAGPPNVGKSSLLNRLTMSDRAIVNAAPGTTRDLIEDAILVEGVLINLVDTAGLHDSSDPVEQEGMQRSLRAMAGASVVILVAEAGDAGTGRELRQHVAEGIRMIQVYNKIDLHGTTPVRGNDADGTPVVSLCALTGAGVDLLRGVLLEVSGVAAAGEDLVLARARHLEALERTAAHLRRGLDSWHGQGAAEILAEELHQAQHSLGIITGEFTADDLLGEIFARFCIGK